MNNDKDPVAVLMGAVAAVVFLIVAIPGILFISSIINAFVLSTLWGWYVVPFFGIKPLPLVYAFGVSLIVSYLTNTQYHGEDKRELKEKFIYGLAVPTFALLFGWVGTWFM